MKIEELFIHDSLIKSVTENPETDEFTFNIDWPKDCENQIFVNAYLIFENVLNYEVHEGSFAGNPTILDILEDGKRTDHKVERIKYKIETNAGFRTLFSTNLKLIEKK